MLRLAHISVFVVFIVSLGVLLSSCSQIEPKPYEPSVGHITHKDLAVGEHDAAIPELATAKPILPEPQNTPDLERYTVVVNEVPVKELLFALARDAKVNVDIAQDIDGAITLNAVEQTLPQILQRISRQVDIRYEFDGVNILISKDVPYYYTYKVDYVNMSRLTDSQITIATQISTTGGASDASGGGTAGAAGGGNNNSTTDVQSISINNFWENLVQSIKGIIGEDTESSVEINGEVSRSNNVIPSPEAGVLTVNATAKQHEQIQQLIDKITESANRQVLVQATIVEVTLNDRYQAGIDWSFMDSLAGLSFSSTGLTAAIPAANLLGPALGGVITYTDNDIGNEGDELNASVTLLEEFGDTRVLSSPQLMVLNNQTAVLKVVDNVVFFTIEQESSQTQTSNVTTFETTVHTVPVGIVMSVTPFVSDSDSVTLNVRPTISRILRQVADPNPALFQTADGTPLANPIENNIPEIAVREMESMLRMNNGQIAVLGGLMQDQEEDVDRGLPGFSKIPGIGKAFKANRIQNSKTELVIFLKPTVIKNPSVDGDLELYRELLRQSLSDDLGRVGNEEG